jgi:hypothetical protein
MWVEALLVCSQRRLELRVFSTIQENAHLIVQDYWTVPGLSTAAA